MKLNELYTTDLHDEGAELRILDGEGNETDLYIKGRGMDSKAFRQHAKRHQKQYLEALRQKKDFDDEELNIQGLADCTIGWRGVDEKFSKKMCLELYRKAPYIKEQIDTFMGDRANFIKAKPKK